MTDFDFSLERTASGEYACPSDGCFATLASVVGLIQHHSNSHTTSIAADSGGRGQWYRYLSYMRGEGWSIEDIYRDLPEHIGRDTVRRGIREMDVEDVPQGPRSGSAAILALPYVKTIEDAREVAKRRRVVQS